MYVCRKMKLCAFLLKNGFHYKKTRPDRYDTKRIVWLFDYTPELLNAVNTYYGSSIEPAANK